MNPFGVSGKTVVVTGARQGLGKVFAQSFAEAGAEVFLMARNVPALEAAAAEIAEKSGTKCRIHPIDVLSETSVAAAADYVRTMAGRLDVLINNAAVGRGNAPLQDATLEEWNLTMGTNSTGTFLCMKHFGRIMIEGQSGCIINLTSLAERVVLQGTCTGAYDVSKAAIACLTRCMAAEWAKYNIRVNSISPGLFLTDINRDFVDAHPGFYNESKSRIPRGRWGEPKEIGALAVFLASDAADYITGADMHIDGGYALW